MRKSYRKIIPMRLKFAAASATGRTRCGEFVDQKDEQPIGRDQRPETSGRKMEERKFPTSSFVFLRKLAAENVKCPAREVFRSLDATPFLPGSTHFCLARSFALPS